MAARSCSYRARIAQECVELCIIQVPEARLVFPDVSVRENPLLGCVGTTGGGGDAIRRAGDIGRDLADGIAQRAYIKIPYYAGYPGIFILIGLTRQPGCLIRPWA